MHPGNTLSPGSVREGSDTYTAPQQLKHREGMPVAPKMMTLGTG
jgi:hypothetical protein